MGGEPALVYCTLTVTSVKGLAYVFVLVRVISQRVFWFAVVVGMAAEAVTGVTVAEAGCVLDRLVAVVSVVGWRAVVADEAAEDVTGEAGTD
jgi:hypothetical protein